MTLIKTQVKTYRIDKVCNKCNEGLLIANGNSMHFNFYSLHTHICNKCGEVVQLQNEIYPHEITEDIGKPKKIKEVQDLLAEQQNIVNEINYNNLAAKATLGDLPIMTVEGLSVSTHEGNNTITLDGGCATLTIKNDTNN
jgi:hypothetical protein